MDAAMDLNTGLVLPVSDGLCLDNGTITVADVSADSACVFDTSALTSLAQEGMVIDGDPNNRVIHLQIQQAGQLDQPLNGHVFYVYHDAFTCGACNKGMNDMIAFIHHKSTHTIGMDVYQCELCTIVFPEQVPLLEHYISEHKLNFSTLENTKVDATDSLQPPSPDEPIETVPSSLSPPSVAVKTLSSKRRKSIQQERKEAEPEEVVSPLPAILKEEDESPVSINDSKADDKKTDDKDFTFVYSTETVKGPKLTFTRSWFKCLHCDYKTRMKRCLVKHMGERHTDTFEAVHDNMEVKGEPEYNIHQKPGESQTRLMRMSTYDRMYPVMGQQRKRRLEKQDIPGVYTCHQCNKNFGRLRYLRKHAKQHTSPATKTAMKASDKKFACETCGKCFKFHHYLQAHRRSHDAKLFRCNECDFVSNINAAIHAHRQIHNQGSVLCDICGYAYSDRSTLTKHYRVHDLTRPYACSFPGCTWRFKSEVMCRAHVRAHTTEGKFRCWLCGYLFRHKHHLQRHVSKMHKLKLSVKEIDAQCKNQNLVTETSDIAEDNAPQITIQCKDCGLDFETRELLEEHFVKSHQIQLSVQDFHDFCNSNLITNTRENGENGDTDKYVITATVAPETLEENTTMEGMDSMEVQPVYVTIDQGTLAQFEADPNSLEVNQLYVQEEQEVPICTDSISDDPGDDKTYFVSVL